MATADAVIIGCGIVGASVAYHLRRRGGLKVTVLERDVIGQGSTGRCNGGVRLQFATEINLRLSLLSTPVFERFEEEFGVDPDFRQFGYLLLATTPERSLASWLFLKHWLGDEPSGTWATVANYYPINQNAINSPAVKAYLEKNPVYARGFDFLKNSKSEPNVPGWQGARDAISNGLIAVITNKATPEQSIDATIKAVNDVLKQ